MGVNEGRYNDNQSECVVCHCHYDDQRLIETSIGPLCSECLGETLEALKALKKEREENMKGNTKPEARPLP